MILTFFYIKGMGIPTVENHMSMTKRLGLSKETLHVPPGYEATSV